MFKIRYKKATGEIVEWGETITEDNDEYGVIEEQDNDLEQYVTLACSVANKALVVDRAKIDKIKTAKPLEIEKDIPPKIEAEPGIDVNEVRK